MSKQSSIFSFSWISVGASICVGLILTVAFWNTQITQKHKIVLVILSAVLAGLLTTICVAFVRAVEINRSIIGNIWVGLEKFKKSLLAESRDILYKTLFLRPCKFVSPPGKEPSLETLLGELADLNKKGLAFSFAIDSLRRIRDTGFVQVMVDVDCYSKFLADCCEKVERTLYATCKKRPLWFLISPNRCKHLNFFKAAGKNEDGPATTNKLRLVILDKQQISKIFQESLENLCVSDESLQCDSLIELPEVQFFLDEVNDVPTNFKVYWSLENSLRDDTATREYFGPILDALNRIPDFAIFDTDFVLKFEFIGEHKGNMSLEWGNRRKTYASIFEKILEKDPAPPDKLEDFCGNGNPDLESFGIYRTFKRLCEAKKDLIDPPLFSIEKVCDDVCKILELDKTSHPTLKECVNKGIYKKIIENLRSGKFKLKSEYQITLETGQLAELQVTNEWDTWINDKGIR